MKHVFVISRDAAWTGAVTRRLRHVHGVDASAIHCCGWSDAGLGEPLWVVQTHGQLADWIESVVTAAGDGPLGLRGTLALLDVEGHDNPSEVDLTEQSDWSAVAAMLVLTFPEVYWVFRSPFCAAHGAARAGGLVAALHCCGMEDGCDHAVRLLAAGYETMFDPAGLRTRLRRNLGRKDRDRGKTGTLRRPLRERAAASIDEEEAYAYFNAYTAYRFGYSAHVVTSYAVFEWLFGEARSTARLGLPELAGRPAIDLLFEDLFLNFPDRPQHLHLSQLRDRSTTLLRGLESKRTHRIFVTVGERTGDEEETTDNERFVEELKAKGINSKILSKPLSGLHDMWYSSGIWARNAGLDSGKRARRKLWLLEKLHRFGLRRRDIRKGFAPGFNVAPPEAGANEELGDHSTPGRLYAIATRLLFRCRRLTPDATSVSDALQGALLALEAQELLGGRTPTISLEAIELKHDMEVMAECMFHGLERRLDVSARYGELEHEVSVVSRWFGKRAREMSELNALTNVVSQLVIRFREFNQFDEEQAALAKLRLLHRRWRVKNYRLWGNLARLPLWYFDKLLSSLIVFCVMLAVWTIVLTTVYVIWPSPDVQTHQHNAFVVAVTEAVLTFFGAQPPTDLAERPGLFGLLPVVGALGVIFAFVHLGIFISHLYAIIARK